MRPNFTLPELQTRLDRLDQGAMLRISEDVRGGTDRRPGRKQGGISPGKDVFGRFGARDAVVGSRSVCVRGEPLEAERAPPFALPRPVQCWTRFFALVLLRSTMTIAE